MVAGSNAKQAALLAVIAAIAVLLSIVSYQYYSATAQEISEIVTTSIQKESRAESFHLSSLLENRIRLIDNNLATLAASPSLQRGDEEDARMAINNREHFSADISDRYVWLDSEGRTLWSSGFVNPEEYQQYRGADVSFREYFTGPRDTGRPYYSAIIDSLDGNPRLFLSYPIADEQGDFRGIVMSAITLDTLGRNLEMQLSPEIEASVIITDVTGIIAYSANPAHIGAEMDASIINVSDEQGFEEFLQQSLGKSYGSQDFAVGGNEQTVAFAPVTIGSDHFLTVYVVAPHNVADAVAPLLLQHNSFITAVILGIGAATVGIAFVIVWWNRTLQASVTRKTQELKGANEDLVAANKQLEVNDRLQKEFINIAAHELRTPIQPILGMTEILEGELGERREDIRLIARNARRLERLTENILDVSRIESESLQLDAEEFDLDKVITPLVQDYRNRMVNVKLLYERGGEKITVNADRERVAQVVSNLLGNAFKFTSSGTVSISVKKTDKEALVSVADTGSGVDPEISPRLFTKFATKSDKGTGLGLFISKSIVEAHGGKIWAENNPDGKGATFTFSLPLG